jgi:DNA polymerase III delta prime subunit
MKGPANQKEWNSATPEWRLKKAKDIQSRTGLDITGWEDLKFSQLPKEATDWKVFYPQSSIEAMIPIILDITQKSDIFDWIEEDGFIVFPRKDNKTIPNDETMEKVIRTVMKNAGIEDYTITFLYIKVMKENTLYVERFRPTELKYYVGNEHIKEMVQKYLDQGDIQNFIFYGPPGSGKTTLAKIIVKNLDCDYLYINASDENGIDTIRDKVKGFASAASWKGIKVVILDEADFITIQGQAALRNVIETFSRSTRFILTCNFVERIIDPLQSRCQVLKIVPPTKMDVYNHLTWILADQLSLSYTPEDIKSLIVKYYPDMRKMLNVLQMSEKDDKIVLDETVVTSNNYIKEVLKELAGKKNWLTIRQIIADSNVKDFEELYRNLFEYSPKYAPGSEGSVAIILNEHLYQANFRIDKEINVMSAIAKIIEVI